MTTNQYKQPSIPLPSRICGHLLHLRCFQLGSGIEGFFVIMKVCKKCGIEKSLDCFNRQKLGKFGVASRCKICTRQDTAEWAKNNREKLAKKLKNWRDANREHVRAESRRYYQENREKHIASVISWQKKNPESKLASGAIYRSKNQASLKEWRHKNKGIVYDHSKNRTLKERSATPPWLSNEQKKIIKTIYAASRRISLCTGIMHNVDHIYPLNHDLLCGLHVPANLRIIPARINAMKKNNIERSYY